jgi:hypothetical protein
MSYYTPYTTNCAILNPLYDTDTDHWMKFTAPKYMGTCFYNLAGNYWGTENTNLINRMIQDGDDHPGLLEDIVEKPILTLDDDLSDIYPFVTSIWLTDSGGNVVDDTAPGVEYTVHVTFNRDMDQTLDPMITYGPADPYTDYSVSGRWVDARTWEGTTTISMAATAGTMYFRAKGGRAADDTWLVCGTDQLRFAFDVSVTEVEALNLSANGGVNSVELSWWQSDYATLAGYDIYRSTKADSGFTKLNTTVITGDSYTDRDVAPGVTYYYYFVILDTDGNTLAQSNTASATPKDNVAPVVTHTAVTTATAGAAISLSAKVTDNIGVDHVSVFYRTAGSNGDFTERRLDASAVVTNGYTGIIPADAVTAAGVEYYLVAYDGSGNTASSGTAEIPFTVTVDTTPKLYGVNNPNFTAGTTVTLSGANLTENMTVSIGDTPATNVQFIDATQITFTAPALKPGSYTLSVTDGTTTVALASAVIYQDSDSYIMLKPGLEVTSGFDLEVPLYIGSQATVESFYLEVEISSTLFDTSKITVSDNCTSSYTNGVLYITKVSTDAIDIDDPVATITLKPKAVSEDTVAQLNITTGRINGADANSVQGSAVTIYPNFNLTATVSYYNGGAAVSGVTVSGGAQSGSTDENGQVILSGITNPSVTVSANRTDNAVSSAITAHDAALVLQYLVKMITLTDNQLLAGDLNGDGKVNETDALIIMKMVVGKMKGQTWTFSPASASMNLSNSVTNVRFTAILKGDVDGSWKEAAQ